MERAQLAVTARAMVAGHGEKGLLSSFPCTLILPKKNQKNVWNKRQAVRAKEGRKPSEVKRTEFQLLNDFMTTISFKCWSLSGWFQQISTIAHTCHTTKLHSRVQQRKSHLHDWAALLLYSEYFYIVNTSSIACRKTVTFHVFFKIHS